MDIEEKKICYDCIGELFLKAEIEKEGSLMTCSYCGNDELESYTLLHLADRVHTAFEQHYDCQSEYHPDNWSLERIKEDGPDWEPTGMPVVEAIMEAAKVEENVAIDLQELLAETHFSMSSAEIGESSDYDSNLNYDIKTPDDREWQELWANFENDLLTKARFFNKKSEVRLKKIFDGIEYLETHDKKPVVRYIGPSTEIEHLYRARFFQSNDKLAAALQSPDKELGPPPSKFVNAGRMNARGISVFYGATHPKTALSEIRPPVGSNVAVGKFELTRQLKVLDLTALTYTSDKGSIFDKKYGELLSKTMFLRKLSQRMTKPVMPDDENFEYLPTQAISDFLGSVLEFDGIIYPSAQYKGGLNIVLFHEASRVQSINHPAGTEVDVQLYDWDEDMQFIDYSVTTWLPKKTIVSDGLGEKMGWGNIPEGEPEDADSRNISMKIDQESIKVEYITSVEINSTSFQVANYTYETPIINPLSPTKMKK